jgi:engulfment/cell motility protein 1
MSSHTIEDLSSCILDFQANIIRVTHRKKTAMVDPAQDPSQRAALDYIWSVSKLQEEGDHQGRVLKWQKLGFDSEDLVEEFNDSGVLGLECLVRIGHFNRTLKTD